MVRMLIELKYSILAANNTYIFFKEHREGKYESFIEEYSVIAFVTQIPGGKWKPEWTYRILGSIIVSSEAFCPTSLPERVTQGL